MLSVTTVTRSPEVFFRGTTTESEAVGELETQQPPGVDVTELLPTLIQSVTAQPDLASEPGSSFVMPPTGQ